MMGNRQLTRAKVLPDGTIGPTEFLAEMASGDKHGPTPLLSHQMEKHLCNCRKRKKSSHIRKFKDSDQLERRYAPPELCMWSHVAGKSTRRLGHEDGPRWE